MTFTSLRPPRCVSTGPVVVRLAELEISRERHTMYSRGRSTRGVISERDRKPRHTIIVTQKMRRSILLLPLLPLAAAFRLPSPSVKPKLPLASVRAQSSCDAVALLAAAALLSVAEPAANQIGCWTNYGDNFCNSYSNSSFFCRI